MKLSRTLEFLVSLPYFGIISTVESDGVPVHVLSFSPSGIPDDVSAVTSALGLKSYCVTDYRLCLMSKSLGFSSVVKLFKSYFEIF